MKIVKVFLKRFQWFYITLALFTFLTGPVRADTRIAVLDWELKDLTLIPNTPEELERTASIKPLLQKELKKNSAYIMVNTDSDTQKEADEGVGYLFNHHEIAASLGKKFAAQYIVVGRVHKPSFLFSYLMAHLIEVKTERLIGNYVIEIKGPSKKITGKGIEALAKKIKGTLNGTGVD